MTDLQQQYDNCPVPKSPASLDATILLRAKQQSKRYQSNNKSGWLPGWPPVAASAAVACLCLFLVLRPDFKSSAPYAPTTAETASQSSARLQQYDNDSTDTTVARNIQKQKAVQQQAAPLVATTEPGMDAEHSLATDDTLTVTESLLASNSREEDNSAKAQEPKPLVIDEKAVGASSKAEVLADKIRELEQTASIEMEVAAPDMSAPIPVPAPSSIAANSIATNSTAETVATHDEEKSAIRPASSATVAELPAEVATPPTATSGVSEISDQPLEPLAGFQFEHSDSSAMTSNFNAPDTTANPAASPAANLLEFAPQTDSADTREADPDRQQMALTTAAWLEALPANHFVLQLSIGRDLTAMKDELQLAGYDLKDIQFQPLTLRGDPGYAALSGPFATKTDAYNRARQIEQQGRLKPWVREISEFVK